VRQKLLIARRLVLTEGSNAGLDGVHSSVSRTLAANIEILFLISRRFNTLSDISFSPAFAGTLLAGSTTALKGFPNRWLYARKLSHDIHAFYSEDGCAAQ
jgi:hypothetical protein